MSKLTSLLRAPVLILWAALGTGAVALAEGTPAADTQDFTLEGKGGKRYSGGDANGQIIPVNPGSQSSVCPTDTMVRLRREVSDLDKLMRGDQTPGQESDGVVELGEAIKKQLVAIGK